MIRNLVLTNSGSEDDAQDIYQDGIIVIYEKAKNNQLNELICSIKTYLYSVCKNIWLKELKHRGIYVPITDTNDETVSIDDDSDEIDIISVQQEILVKLINVIGESCKQILIYFYWEKLSMNEIAEKMGYTNAGNAKTQKYKCIKRLQKLAIEKYETENIIES